MIANFKKPKKRPWQTLFFSIFLALLVISAVGFLVATNWKIGQRRAELQEKREVLEKEIKVLEEQVASLQADIKQTETDDYQTKKLYEEGYFPTGSVPIVVLPPEEEAAEKDKTTEEKNSWQKLLEVLGF